MLANDGFRKRTERQITGPQAMTPRSGRRGAPPALLRRLDAGDEAEVTFEELFFDLVYVFAVTQLSHTLLHHLTGIGAVQTLILWFAVWLGWQYTCWFTNWFDPETPQVRAVLFASMLLALVMAAAIPEAFGERGLVFAACFATMQVGRCVFILFYLKRGTALRANYIRILIWSSIAACFWLAGGFAADNTRMALWIVAVLCEYVSPMFGFRLPVLGRSETKEWTIEGSHLAERCQLFVIVALGENILAAGETFAETEHWASPVVAGLLVTFLASIAMWLLYFYTSSKAARRKIMQSDDPGRIGAYFHYVHVILVGGIIVTAVGSDLIDEAPLETAGWTAVLTLLAGPALYFLGSALYKRVVTGHLPASHVAGIAALAVLAVLAGHVNLLTLGSCAVVVMFAAAYWDTLRLPHDRLA